MTILRRLASLLVLTASVLVGSAGAALAYRVPVDPQTTAAPGAGDPSNLTHSLSTVAGSGLSGWAVAGLVLVAVIVGMALGEIAHGIARHHHVVTA